MKKLLTALPAVLVLVSTIASPASAQKRSEYNFNTCNYNFYGQANPMNGQGAAGGPVSFYKGKGHVGASAESLKQNMGASIYSQTPQRTKTWDNLGFQRKKVRQQMQVQQTQQQQASNYFYVPGQNVRAGQNMQSNGQDVGYQFNNSGVASYDAVNTTDTTQDKQR